MARNFNELRDKLRARLGPRKWAAHEAEGKATIAEYRNMEELRQARSMTQTGLAQALKISQGAVSKVERRTDMYISTLRGYVRAMGGDVQIRAIFPEGEVILNQFQDLDAESLPPAKRIPARKREAVSAKPMARRARTAAGGR
jgi:transcriptional regulator with XRE-family HTH domain